MPGLLTTAAIGALILRLQADLQEMERLDTPQAKERRTFIMGYIISLVTSHWALIDSSATASETSEQETKEGHSPELV